MLNSVCNTIYMQARHVSSMQPTLPKYAINPVVKIKYEFIFLDICFSSLDHNFKRTFQCEVAI